jgi:hypothetical protein
MSPAVAFFLGIALTLFLVVVYGIVAMASREEAIQDAATEARARRARIEPDPIDVETGV